MFILNFCLFLHACLQRYIGHTLPALLPKERTGSEAKLSFPQQFAFQGYCPVTYSLGNQAYESIVPGNPLYVVEYDGLFFSFADQQKVMRRPSFGPTQQLRLTRADLTCLNSALACAVHAKA